MDRAAFWKIIDEARDKVEDVYEAGKLVSDYLATLDADAIVAFKQHQCDLESESYRWDLWAVAYIVNGGCSDDGFDYFRAWLMANGKQRWESAMANPESIGQWAVGEADFEDFCYVAITAYEAQTGNDFPYEKVTSNLPSDPLGNPWDEEELETLYPALCKKYF